MRLIHELNEFADDNTTFTIDGGDIGVEAAKHRVANRSGSQLSNASILGSLGPALQRAFDSGKPGCINVMIATQGDL